MNETEEATVKPSKTPRLGLAMASLVLGIFSIFLSIVMVGVIPGVVGIALGAWHLARRQHGRALAKWGLGVSVLGTLAGVVVCTMFASLFMRGASGYDFDPWIGVRAPDMTLPALDGKEYTLSDLKGRRVVIDRWATWCPPCVQEIPHFIQLAGEIPADDLLIIGVSKEDHEILNKFIAEKGINYPIVSQSGLPSPYGDVTGIPTTFFIDRNGVIQEVFVGYRDYDELRAAATAEDFAGEVRDEIAMEAGN